MRKGIGPKGLGVSPLKQGEEIKPIKLDEVVINAVNRNKLTPDERKVYSKFYRGRTVRKTKNPNLEIKVLEIIKQYITMVKNLK